MIGLVATLHVDETKAEVFEDIFREIMALVRQEEAGCLLYQLTKSRTEASVYKVLELYTDLAAVTAHGENETLREPFARMQACLLRRPEVEYLDGVV